MWLSGEHKMLKTLHILLFDHIFVKFVHALQIY